MNQCADMLLLNASKDLEMNKKVVTSKFAGMELLIIPLLLNTAQKNVQWLQKLLNLPPTEVVIEECMNVA